MLPATAKLPAAKLLERTNPAAFEEAPAVDRRRAAATLPAALLMTGAARENIVVVFVVVVDGERCMYTPRDVR